jgi:hypothetical protein
VHRNIRFIKLGQSGITIRLHTYTARKAAHGSHRIFRNTYTVTKRRRGDVVVPGPRVQSFDHPTWTDGRAGSQSISAVRCDPAAAPLKSPGRPSPFRPIKTPRKRRLRFPQMSEVYAVEITGHEQNCVAFPLYNNSCLSSHTDILLVFFDPYVMRQHSSAQAPRRWTWLTAPFFFQ